MTTLELKEDVCGIFTDGKKIYSYIPKFDAHGIPDYVCDMYALAELLKEDSNELFTLIHKKRDEIFQKINKIVN